MMELELPAILYIPPYLSEIMSYSSWKFAKQCHVILQPIPKSVWMNMTCVKLGLFFKLEPRLQKIAFQKYVISLHHHATCPSVQNKFADAISIAYPHTCMSMDFRVLKAGINMTVPLYLECIYQTIKKPPFQKHLHSGFARLRLMCLHREVTIYLIFLFISKLLDT